MFGLQHLLGVFILLICLGCSQPSWAIPLDQGSSDSISIASPLTVVTTTSDLKSLVEFVGGDRVRVRSIALPAQDPHSFEPKPSNFQQLKAADLVVKVGLDHDLWIDQMLAEVGTSAIRRGGTGYIDTSVGIPLLEVRARAIAPLDGHNHGAGNPHYWLDPFNAQTMTGAIMEGLSRIDPDHATLYETNRAAFLTQLDVKLAEWEQHLASYQGQPVIAYHNSWPYLARRFRLNVVDYIEPKPGVPPSPTHLANLLREIKEQHISLIIKEPYESDQIPRLLSRKTGATVATLVSSVGAVPQAQNYFSLFDYNIKALVEAFNG
jgi:zinc/manganese transport system substrate-binding protein/zinc transport system substrate-binding protein